MSKDTHALERTNAKGQPFVGVCTKCGQEGLSLSAAQEPCSNPANLSQADALKIALGVRH
jgi:hypothetical protein